MRDGGGCANWLAESLYQAAGQGGRALDADLLAEYSSHCKFETVPAPRNAEPWSSLQPGSQSGVGFQTAHDCCPIGIQIKHGADAFDNEKEGARIAKLKPHLERVMRFVVRDLKIAVSAVQENGAPIGAAFDRFDAGRGASCQKRQHTFPVVGRTETKAEQVMILWLVLGLPREAPDLRRSAMIDLANTGVESPYATETRSKGNLAHRQAGLVDELLGKVQSACPCHRDRSRSQMLEEEAAKMARANSQTFRENFNPATLQAALADQT